MNNELTKYFFYMLDEMSHAELKSFSIGVFGISLASDNPFEVAELVLKGENKAKPPYDEHVIFASKKLVELADATERLTVEKN